MKKVLFFTNYFSPEIFRGNDIAFHLAKRGYDVTVLTNIPNYPEGRYYDGYGLFHRRKENVNGVKVIRVPVIPRGDGGKLRMALNYVSGLFFMYLYALHHALWHRYDVVFVQQLSPVFIGLPAVLVKKMQRAPIYYWLLDLWPDSLVAGGINNEGVIKYIGKLTKHIYDNCSKILISSLGFRDILTSRGVGDEKIEYFPNWCEDNIASGEVKEIPTLPDGFKIMFAGNIGEAQNFDNLMQVMLRLKDNHTIKWIIVGDGRKRDELRQFVERNSLDSTVYLMGRYDISYMSSFFKQADVLLVSLTNEFVFNSTLPAKVQAYMAASKPILGMMNGEGQYIIHDAECGYCVGAEDIDGFVEIVKSLPSKDKSELLKLGDNGHRYYERLFRNCLNLCKKSFYDDAYEGELHHGLR